MKGFALALILFSIPCHALTVEELQEKMLQSETQVRSLEFDYVQQMESSLTSEKKKSEGKGYVKKPKQIRIEQKTPENQLIVTAGKSVYIYTPRFQQVIEQPWNQWFAQNMFFPGLSGFSDALKKLMKEFQWEILSPNGNQELSAIRVRLVRKDRTGSPTRGDQNEQLDLWMNASDFIPYRTQYTFGTLTLTTALVSYKMNQELNVQLFEFKKPEGAKVIKIR